MPRSNKESLPWGDKERLAASEEGWNLFDANGRLEVERDDEKGLFADDEEAKAHVLSMAERGFSPAINALAAIVRSGGMPS